MFIIRPDEIASTLTYDACIGVMKEAMMRLSAGDSEQMLRQILPLDGGRMFGVMAGTMGPGAAFGSKLICVTPERGPQPVPSHQGVVVVFDTETGGFTEEYDPNAEPGEIPTAWSPAMWSS